jgi:hypothetical protein
MSLDTPSLFASFLAALADPEGGESLHQMHSNDALVRYPDGLGAAAGIDRGQFSDAHREISLRDRESLPLFGQPKPLRVAVDSDVMTSVAWFELTEEREPRQLIAALGVKMVDGEPRIGWVTLVPRIEDWSYQHGLLQSLADYAWMRTAQPARSRALLDASYFRQHWREPVKFTSLPEARFSCQMSTVCCKHDFEILLPPEAQLVIDAMPWETLRPHLSGTKLPLRSDGKLQLKTVNETCRFLGGAGQCLIHQTVGRQPFGPCCIFPIAFARTPEGIAVGLSPICGSTRNGAGIPLSDREDDLREKLAHIEPRKADGFRLSPGVSIPWESFRDIEKALCEVLAATDVPMRRRLHLGSRLLGAVRDKEAVDINRWVGEAAEEISSELREAILQMLGKIVGWDREVLKRLPQTIPAALFAKEVREPTIVAGVLQNTLFCKTYSYTYDLTTAHNFLIVLYLLAIIMQEAAPGPMSDPMWRELGALGVHGLLKSVLHDAVPDGFRAVFGTAEFGLWMLSA